jgi:hypothetical protein
MSEFQAYFNSESTAWLDVLPKYQRNSVDALLAEGKSYDEVAESWLAATVAYSTLGFGVAKSSKVFFTKVLDEMHDLLCTDRGYQEERKSVLASFKDGKALAAASITEAISPHVGAAAAFLSVAVVCVLSVISKVSLGAWCQMQTERRAATGATE